MWLWVNVITTTWGGVPNGTLPMMFMCCPNLMFLASLWLEIYRFLDWSFHWLWAAQSWFLFCSLWASQNWPYLFSFATLDRSQLFSDWSFCYFEKFTVNIYCANFGQIKIDPVCSLLLLWTGHSYSTEFG